MGVLKNAASVHPPPPPHVSLGSVPCGTFHGYERRDTLWTWGHPILGATPVVCRCYHVLSTPPPRIKLSICGVHLYRATRRTLCHRHRHHRRLHRHSLCSGGGSVHRVDHIRPRRPRGRVGGVAAAIIRGAQTSRAPRGARAKGLVGALGHFIIDVVGR